MNNMDYDTLRQIIEGLQQKRNTRSPELPRKAKGKDTPPNSRIFVRCSKDLDEENLRRLCSNYGEVEYVKIVEDRESKKKKGTAFVKFANAAQAAMAIKSLNGLHILNAMMYVELAESKSSSESGAHERTDVPPRSRIYVTCDKNETDQSLHNKFCIYGDIEHIKVLRDKVDRPRGSAFIKFSTAEAAALSLRYNPNTCQLAENRQAFLSKATVSQTQQSDIRKTMPMPMVPASPHPGTASGVPIEILGRVLQKLLAGEIPTEAREPVFQSQPCQPNTHCLTDNTMPLAWDTTLQQLDSDWNQFNGEEEESPDWQYMNDPLPPTAPSSTKELSPNDRIQIELLALALAQAAEAPVVAPAQNLRGSLSTQIGRVKSPSQFHSPLYSTPSHAGHLGTEPEKQGQSLPSIIQDLLRAKLSSDAMRNEAIAPQPQVKGTGDAVATANQLMHSINNINPYDVDYPRGSRLFFSLSMPLPQETLNRIFSQFGDLEKAYLIRTLHYGFAKYSTAEAAQRAIAGLNNIRIEGVDWRVTPAKPRSMPSSDSTGSRLQDTFSRREEMRNDFDHHFSC